MIPEKNTIIIHCPKLIAEVWNIPWKVGTYIIEIKAPIEIVTAPIRYMLVKGFISNSENFSLLHSNT